MYFLEIMSFTKNNILNNNENFFLFRSLKEKKTLVIEKPKKGNDFVGI